MKSRIYFLVVGATLLLPAAATWAAGAVLPGDRGRPLEGIMPVAAAPRPANATPPPPRQPDRVAATPSLDVALKAAQAIDAACKQYPLGIAVIDSEGVARLIYVPDRSAAWHGYSAVRKAYTAVVFKEDSSKVMKKAQEDPEVATKVKSDPNLQAFSGGLVLKVGDKVIGAIGVSGAEPGGHDEECGLIGLEKIRNDLQ